MLHTDETTTCPAVDDPNNYHFSLICEDCEIQRMLRMTLRQVEAEYHQTRISQRGYEAYTHVWATSPGRLATYDHWATPPADPGAQRVVRKILRARVAR